MPWLEKREKDDCRKAVVQLLDIEVLPLKLNYFQISFLFKFSSLIREFRFDQYIGQAHCKIFRKYNGSPLGQCLGRYAGCSHDTDAPDVPLPRESSSPFSFRISIFILRRIIRTDNIQSGDICSDFEHISPDCPKQLWGRFMGADPFTKFLRRYSTAFTSRSVKPIYTRAISARIVQKLMQSMRAFL